MNKLFKRVVTGIFIVAAVVAVMIGTAYASKYTTGFSTSTACKSNNYYFDGLEGSSIRFIALYPNCAISDATYDVSLWKDVAGTTMDTHMPNEQTFKVPTNGLGSNYAWWYADAYDTYYFFITAHNNYASNGQRQPITCINVRFENFYDEDLMG